eukprot:13963380-Alexandrium_andersonii.AAC.1
MGRCCVVGTAPRPSLPWISTTAIEVHSTADNGTAQQPYSGLHDDPRNRSAEDGLGELQARGAEGVAATKRCRLIQQPK